MTTLRLTTPLPPSDNSIYVPFRRGGKTVGRTLSDAARAYKTKVAGLMAEAALSQPQFVIADAVEYAITLTVYLECVYSKGWPKRAKSRFRRIDSQNRIKLVIDAVTDGMGIDDSCLFEQHIVKREDPENPRIEVEVRRCGSGAPEEVGLEQNRLG